MLAEVYGWFTKGFDTRILSTLRRGLSNWRDEAAGCISLGY